MTQKITALIPKFNTLKHILTMVSFTDILVGIPRSETSFTLGKATEASQNILHEVQIACMDTMNSRHWKATRTGCQTSRNSVQPMATYLSFHLQTIGSV
jgi:hypothetical protein